MKRGRSLALCLPVALLAGCGFSKQAALGVGAKVAESKELDNVASPQKSVMLHGFLERLFSDIDSNALVVASTEDGTVVASVSVGTEGYYSLFVPPGTYQLAAYVDRDRDGVIYPHEVAGVAPSPIVVREGHGVCHFGVDLQLSLGADAELGADADLGAIQSLIDEPVALEFGIPSLESVEDLAATIFDKEYIDLGTYKSTTAFFSQVAPLQYLHQLDFTSDKVPVVLVHGINDSPQVFSSLAKKLDNQRFEPIFYYFPSGARLLAMARLLHHLFFSSQALPPMKHSALIAHSMGGLVARGSLNELSNEKLSSHVDIYGSFVSPYGGVDLANFGIKTGPVIVPSWIDVASKSDYVRKLFAPLPVGTEFYMANGNAKGTSDGVIALSSQRRKEAVEQAKDTVVFPQTHVGIMQDEVALTTMLRWVDGALPAVKKQSESAAVSDSERKRRARAVLSELLRHLIKKERAVYISTVVPTVARIRVQNGEASTVIQLSVGEGIRLHTPGRLEPLFMKAGWDGAASLELVEALVDVIEERLSKSEDKPGPPALPSSLLSIDATSKADNKNQKELPPPVVLGTGLLVAGGFGPDFLRLGIPFRIDGYLGHFGLGSEFRLTTYTTMISVDGFKYYVAPMTIAGGPRFRLGHATSLFSLSLGLSGGIEMGRGTFYPGDTLLADRFSAEALSRVWMTNAVGYGTATAGVKIHRDFYAFVSWDGGVRIPEKKFVIDQNSTVRFEPSPLVNVSAGVEVRLP